MSAEAVFGALRAHKRELTGLPLSQADVDAFNRIMAGWKPAEASQGARARARDASGTPTALRDAQAFYKAVRGSLGALEQSQVDGFGAVLQAIALAGWPVSWAAYALATAWWETARTMQPVKEAYWLSEAWRKKNLRYYPWYGRGYVQLTWEDNYKWADRELGLNGALLANPDKAMEPEIAAAILIRGMEQGAFSKDRKGPRSLARYLPTDREATKEEFRLARPIINIMDKASEIAGLAVKFQDALKAGGWR